MKKIAVITPVFNSEKFIKDCIDSVAFSVVPDGFCIEHIVVDDCSEDNTREILKNINLENLKKYRLEKNSGATYARNYAISKTDAVYIFCLDSDDVIFQSSLKHLVEKITNENLDWVYGDFLRTDKKLSYILSQDYYGYNFDSNKQLLLSMYTGRHFFQQNCMYKRQLFESVHGFDENLKGAQDFDLFTRFLLKGAYPIYLPSPLYLHRFHETNLSKKTGRENNPEAHKEDVKFFYKKYNSEIKKLLEADEIKKIELFLT